MRHAGQSQSSVNRRLCLSTNQKAIYHRETKPQQVILTLVSSSNCDIIMPFINVETNLPASKFPEDLLKKLCTTLAAALGKPEDRMNLVVKTDLPMMIAGSCSPCLLMSLSAIGVTDTAEKNKEHSAKIFQFLKGELGLSDERILILFYPLEPHQIGKKGTVMSFL